MTARDLLLAVEYVEELIGTYRAAQNGVMAESMQVPLRDHQRIANLENLAAGHGATVERLEHVRRVLSRRKLPAARRRP